MSIFNACSRKAYLVVITAFGLSAISGCGGSADDDYTVRSTDSVYAYRAASPYAPVLKQCVLVGTVAESCPLSTLPFIGNGAKTPSVDEVMNRVLVTHDWMGARFEEVVRDAPDSLLTLFSSTTAILIGSEVRPSFYTPLTGAIQIDPAYLWSTVDEKNSISKAEDFRAGFGNDLQFWFLSRVATAEGERLAPYYSIDDDSERPIDDVRLPLLRLLYHELVHATDFMPRDKIATLNPSFTAVGAIESVQADWLSNRLIAAHPLTSDALNEFAQVRYRGETPTPQQIDTSATGMGELMATDGAIQFYSYTSEHEDLAQLVEGVMMGFHYDSIVNVGFTQKPLNEENYSCNDLRVDWGQRNRLADPLVNVRARYAAELAVEVTPELQSYMEAAGISEAMVQSIHWCANQTPTNIIARTESVTRSSAPVRALESGTQFIEMMREDNTVHPDGMMHD